MFINTNIASINSQRNLSNTNLLINKSLEKLSSGKRINSAADDASGLAIVEKMMTQLSGLDSAIQNTQDTSALYKIADGALSQVGSMLGRMEELAVRAGNSTLTADDRAIMQMEMTQLQEQIGSISSNTEYNSIKLLNGNLDIQRNVSQTSGTSGSIRVLAAPGTVQSAANMNFSITTVGSAAVTTGAAASLGGAAAVNQNNTININGADVNVSATDTVDTVISKINSQNSRTGVVAIRDRATNNVSLVTGKLDTDARNVVGAGSAAANGSAIGFLTAGTAATISIGGSSQVWSALGFTGALANYSASGTNAAGTLSGVAMTGQGNTLTMQNAGSKAYGLQVGVDIFNGAQGGYILNSVSAASAINHQSAVGNSADMLFNNSRALNVQTGANYGQNSTFALASFDATGIGGGASAAISSLSGVDISTAAGASSALKVIQKAVSDVSSSRASIGSIMNRLDYTDKTLQVQRENMLSAKSKIMDTDFAAQMTELTKQQLLMNSGIAMLAQANSSSQSVLGLLK